MTLSLQSCWPLVCGHHAWPRRLQRRPPRLRHRPSKNDYSKPTPGCAVRAAPTTRAPIDLTTTVVMADGTMSRETWAADPKAPIDCFYVYPTVSTDPTPNSDMTAGAEERNVIRQQFARFASQCRPFAPLYRQVTLRGLRALLAGGTPPLLDTRRRVRRCARCLELLPEERQRRPRRRAHRALAGLVRPDAAHRARDRRQAGPVAHRSRRFCSARTSPCRKARMSAARFRRCRSAAPATRPAA